MTDGRTDKRAPDDGIGRAYALHRAAKIDVVSNEVQILTNIIACCMLYDM